MNYLALITILVSLYVLFESVSAIANMPGGCIHFCHKIKYVLAFSSSIAFIYYTYHFFQIYNLSGLWLVFGSAGTLAFFVWPRTVHRFKAYCKEFDDLEIGY